MAVMNSPSVLRLGVIKHEDQLYMAILHFRDDNGADRAITETMQKAKDNFAKLFQDVVGTLEGRVQFSEFFADGYVSRGPERTPYEGASIPAADRFFGALNQAQLWVPANGPMVELQNLNRFGNLEEISEEIIEKFRNIHPRKVFEDGDEPLTVDHIGFLTTLGLDKLAAGQFDAKEFNELSRLKDNVF